MDAAGNITDFVGNGLADNVVGCAQNASLTSPISLSSDGTYLYTFSGLQLTKVKMSDGCIEFIGDGTNKNLHLDGTILDRGLPVCYGLHYTLQGLFCSSTSNIQKFY